MTRPPIPPHSLQEFLQLVQYAAGPFTAAEFVLAIAVGLLAWFAPRLGQRRFERLERAMAPIAAHPVRQMVVVGVVAVLARAALLPWLGEPSGAVYDEQSILLQAQTFMHGRLANPTHPFWEHFETYYVNQVPAYASMYFPGRGAPLAAGLLLAGDAWVGAWLSVVLMCVAATWMLQAWVSLPMALLGGLLVTVRLGLFSSWTNSYFGGGFSAFGAMLVIGALPRVLRQPRWTHGVLMGAGAVILMTTRPSEGLLVCLPVAGFLLWRLAHAQWSTVGRTIALRVVLPATVLIAGGVLLMLAYNAATTGDAFKTPWELHRQTYGGPPGFLFSPPIESLQRGPAHFRAYYDIENSFYEHRDSALQLLRSVFGKLFHTWNFYVGPLFTFAFLAGLWAARRNAFLMGTLAFFFAGYLLETFNFPQYTAPLFPLLLILLMRGFEQLRKRPSGLFLTRAMPTAAVLLLAMPLAATLTRTPLPSNVNASCCVTQYPELKRDLVRQLRRSPGPDLVMVESGPNNPFNIELVSNDADIDASDIVWAHKLGPEKDLALQQYFANRRVWEFRWDPEAPKGYQFKASAPQEGDR